MRANARGRSKKQAHGDDGATDRIVEAIDEKSARQLMVESLSGAIKGRKYLSLRQAAKETRFLWIVLKWRDAIEKNSIKEQEYWGGKIEEYCMERAKSEVKIDGMEGANLLMEVVAKALIEQRAKRQIADDSGSPGKRSPQVRQ